MAKPTDSIEWGTDGTAQIAEPTSLQKLVGWVSGKKPPAHWFNWFMRAYWRWIAWLESERVENEKLLGQMHMRQWTAYQAPSGHAAVAYSPSLRRFCAIATASVATSDDGGASWTARTISTSASIWQSICWSPSLSLFVAIGQGYSGAPIAAATSPDGITWTDRAAVTEPTNQWYGVCWSPNLSLFVAVGGSGTNRVMTSPDGITWTARAASAVESWRSVIYAPELGLFLATAAGGAIYFMTSPDGITWTSQTKPASFGGMPYNGVCWSPELLLFVAVSTNGTDRVATSPDGITWTARPGAPANQWHSVAWSPTLRIFCAVAATGTDQVMFSHDGISWYPRRSPVVGDFRHIIWAPEDRVFLAINNSSARPIVSGTGGDISTLQLVGTISADSPSAGRLGERVVGIASAVGSFTTATPKDVTSISLTAGDWDVSAVLTYTAAAITGTQAAISINTTTATHGTIGDNRADTPSVPTAAAGVTLTVPVYRVSIAATTTVYLVGSITFSAGTPAANARISARRVR